MELEELGEEEATARGEMRAREGDGGEMVEVEERREMTEACESETDRAKALEMPGTRSVGGLSLLGWVFLLCGQRGNGEIGGEEK